MVSSLLDVITLTPASRVVIMMKWGAASHGAGMNEWQQGGDPELPCTGNDGAFVFQPVKFNIYEVLVN